MNICVLTVSSKSFSPSFLQGWVLGGFFIFFSFLPTEQQEQQQQQKKRQIFGNGGDSCMDPSNFNQEPDSQSSDTSTSMFANLVTLNFAYKAYESLLAIPVI